jgi:8-oxo-dGTP diphosphatase
MNSKISVSITKNKLGKVLIIQRVRPEKGSDGTHLVWAFPGGRIETDEAPEFAAARETSDETGFTVKPIKIISERQHPQFDYYIYYIACDLDLSKVKPANEVHEIEKSKWVDPTELKDYFETDLDSKVAKYLGL